MSLSVQNPDSILEILFRQFSLRLWNQKSSSLLDCNLVNKSKCRSEFRRGFEKDSCLEVWQERITWDKCCKASLPGNIILMDIKTSEKSPQTVSRILEDRPHRYLGLFSFQMAYLYKWLIDWGWSWLLTIPAIPGMILRVCCRVFTRKIGGKQKFAKHKISKTPGFIGVWTLSWHNKLSPRWANSKKFGRLGDSYHSFMCSII